MTIFGIPKFIELIRGMTFHPKAITIGNKKSLYGGLKGELKMFGERYYLQVRNTVISDLVLSIPFIFILSMILSATLYLIGGLISPKVKKTAAKLAPYACGENLPVRKLQVNAEEFFIYATYFLIFDVLAFMLATSLGKPGFLPILFIFIVFISSLTLPLFHRMGE